MEVRASVEKEFIEYLQIKDITYDGRTKVHTAYGILEMPREIRSKGQVFAKLIEIASNIKELPPDLTINEQQLATQEIFRKHGVTFHPKDSLSLRLRKLVGGSSILAGFATSMISSPLIGAGLASMGVLSMMMTAEEKHNYHLSLLWHLGDSMVNALNSYNFKKEAQEILNTIPSSNVIIDSEGLEA
jgi:hypothetical protein